MSKYFVVALLAIAMVSAFAPTPARADSIDTFLWVPCAPNFTVSITCGPQTTGPGEVTWQAPASPTPTSVDTQPSGLPDIGFTIMADVTANGTDFGPTTIAFTDCLQCGYTGFGFKINGLFVGGEAPRVWSGLDSSPTFIPETYPVFSEPTQIQLGTLTISTASDVPEPSALLQTGAALLIGLAVIAFWRKQPTPSQSCLS
jgi:hypothetical protein